MLTLAKTFVLLLLGWSAFCPEAAFAAEDTWLNDFKQSLWADNAERVMQFLSDPASPDQAWALTEQNLQFNPGLKSQGQWRTRFDRETFRQLTGVAPAEGYRQRRIQFSATKKGTLYLLVENGDEGRSYIFRTNNNGDSWRYTALDGRGKKVVASAASGKSGKGREEAVDLNAMDSEPAASSNKRRPANEAKAGQDYAHYHGVNTQPIFKVLFDLLLDVRPGISPLTFDNYHTLLLVDFIPKPEIQFSFEVSPSPRYYELTYKPSSALAIRAGRIYIPFDQMNPHNSFGGLMNTSKLRQPGGQAFLPDLWTDLGVALQLTLADSPQFQLESQVYCVNGFQDGGTDPAGEIGSKYPSFDTVPFLDNNTDKALGARVHAWFFNTVGLGLSAYSGRYTPNSDPSKRELLLGVDTQLRLPWGMDFRFGYINMNVELPAPSSTPDLQRNGFYLELSQKLFDRFKVAFRMGQAQNDNRLVQVTDVKLFGGALIYDLGMVQFSLQHFKDTNVVPNKVNYEYTALRALVLF